MVPAFRNVVIDASVHPLTEHFDTQTKLIESVARCGIDAVIKDVRSNHDSLLLKKVADSKPDAEKILVVISKCAAQIEEERGVLRAEQSSENIGITRIQVFGEFAANRDLTKWIHFSHRSRKLSGGVGASLRG